jgi:hypothetical protein
VPGARAIALGVVALALLGCAASRSGPSKIQIEYLKAHPLSPDEERRLYAREARRGDTVDRVRVTFDDCTFERAQVSGDIAVWRVHVPIDAREIRIDTDKLEVVGPGSDAMLTFRGEKLESAVIL